MLLAASLAAAACLPACGENQGSGAPSAPSASAPAKTAAVESAKPPESAAIPVNTIAPPASASPAEVPAASGSAAVPAASGSAAAGAKKFDCGAKGQKPCPMQGWMKTVMANASSSGEGDKLAKAMEYCAQHTPPGFDEWASISKTGAAKAKAGDVDGAKAACKQCHDLYKEKYKLTLRDRPF